MIEHLVVDLGVDELASLGLRDRGDRWLIALGQPSVGDHRLGERASGLFSEKHAVAPHGVEEATSLILLGVDAGEGRELALVMALFNDRRAEHHHLRSVAFDEFHFGGVEAELVQPAKTITNAPLFVGADGIGAGELGPQFVVSDLEEFDHRNRIDGIAQFSQYFEFEQTAGHVVLGDLEVMLSLTIGELIVTLTGLGVDEIGNEIAGVSPEERVAERAITPEEADEMDANEQHGQRVDQLLVETLTTLGREQVEVGERIGEVSSDQHRVERFALCVEALVGHADEIDDRELLLFQEGEQLELSIGQFGCELLQCEIAAVVFDESNHVAMTTTGKSHRKLVRPPVERRAPWQVEKIWLGLGGRLQPQGNHVGDAIGQTVEVNASSSALISLPDAANVSPAEPFAGPDHPMRKLTRQVAFEGAWDAERAKKVGDLFDGMAADWSTDHVDATKAAPIADALTRGIAKADGRWLELGSGTGAGTRVLSGGVDSLVAFDLAAEMLAHAPGELAPRVRGDASVLPFADDAFDNVLMVNMLLFPGEVERVLAPGGTVVWVNTLGDQTPIHLPAADVAEALPGAWEGVTANAGTGLWATLRRSV